MNYLAVIAGYLLGSIPFGYVVCKYWKGINIFEHGSGNIGFTNVLRTAGWPPGLLVLAGDIAKGVAAAWLGLRAGGEAFGIFAGLAALVGHSFSIFLKFRGGKLVATGFGVLLILSWQVALTALATWLITVAVTRFVSLGSIFAGLSVPISSYLYGETNSIKLFAVVACSFIIYRHRSNISKLLKGQEYKIGQKADRK